MIGILEGMAPHATAARSIMDTATQTRPPHSQSQQRSTNIKIAIEGMGRRMVADARSTINRFETMAGSRDVVRTHALKTRREGVHVAVQAVRHRALHID